MIDETPITLPRCSHDCSRALARPTGEPRRTVAAPRLPPPVDRRDGQPVRHVGQPAGAAAGGGHGAARLPLRRSACSPRARPPRSCWSGLPAGAWVDRMRFRRVLIVNDLVRAALLGSVPLAQLLGVLTIGQLYVVALATGVSTVFFDVAYQSYLPQLVDREPLVEGNAKLQASESVARSPVPASAALLIQALTAPYAVLIDALSFLWSAALGRRHRGQAAAARAQARPRTCAGDRRGSAVRARQPAAARDRRCAPARPTCSARWPAPCSSCCSPANSALARRHRPGHARRRRSAA